MTPGYVNLNGQLLAAGEARIGILDHGLLYGDGVFETLRVCAGRIFRAEAHLARLADSCRRLALPLPRAQEELRTALEAVVEANAMQEGALRLTLTRGEGAPIPDPAACPQPAFFVTARELKPVAPPGSGAPAWTALITGTHPRTFIPGIKCLSYLPFQQARVEARRQSYDEAILTYQGEAIEASTSNLFAVLDGQLWTPGLDSGCLPGIAREIVLGMARELGLVPVERTLPAETLAEAQEIIVTNSVMGPVPIIKLNDRYVGAGITGPAGTRLGKLYAELLHRECRS